VVHANARARAEEILYQVRDLLPEGEVPVVEISPVIGTHIGPGAHGFICVRKGGWV
jgi:fatty acid-binding protein DegV